MSVLLEDVISQVAPGRIPAEARSFRRREVRGLTRSVERVTPGMVFVALPERSQEDPWAAYAAMERGASAVICEPDTILPGRVARIEVPDSRRAFAQAAAAFFGHPERRLTLFGVRSIVGASDDGTRRPSTNLTHLVAELLADRHQSVPCLSELRCEVGGRSIPRPLSALDAFEFFESLAQAARAGERSVAVEVTPSLESELAICPSLQWCSDAGPSPNLVRSTGLGSVVTLGGRPVSTRLVGRQNLAALAGAVRGLSGMAGPIQRLCGRVTRLIGTPGFLEPIRAGQPFGVFVDAARTPMELIALLADVRSFHLGRILLVVGAPARWPVEQRARLGQALREAGLVILTADDPEDCEVEDLCAEVLRGRDGWPIEPDRERAIFHALSLARPGDVVLLVGKAHSEVQRVGGAVVPWDDRRIAYAALAARGYGGTRL